MSFLWTHTAVYDQTQEAYWRSQTWAPDTQLVGMAANLVHGSVVNLIFTRTVDAGLTEDEAIFGLHLAVDAGPGAPMNSLNAAQAAAVEDLLDSNFALAVDLNRATGWTLKEYQWRNFGADFPVDQNGASKPGPIWRVTPVNRGGSGLAARLPDQTAVTITYRTASRKHWGRTYVGGFTVDAVSPTSAGKVASNVVDNQAGAFRNLFSDMAALGAITNVWVWSPRYRGAVSIKEVSVDDVFDVIRSRRAKYPAYRKTYTS